MSVRKIIAPVVLGAAAAALLVGPAPGQAAAQKFQFPTGRITYKLTSPMMNGSTTLHWSEFGSKFRQEMKAKMSSGQGKAMDLSNWVIYDGANIYMHNPMMGQQVMRMKVTKEMSGVSGAGMPMLAAPKNLGKAVGKGTIAGKACNVHQLPAPSSGKIWVWQNLPLKMEIKGGQMSMTMEATKVETGVPMATNLFKVPTGMQVKDWQPPKGAAAPPRKP